MRVLVFGAGAMGSLIGGCLARKHEVTLVGRRDHVAAVRRDGLVVRGRTELVARPRAVERMDELDPAEPFDLVVLTVKSFDTDTAVAELRPLRERALFLTLQNGLGNAERLAGSVDRVLAGVTYNGVTFTGPGVVDHAGEGETLVGPWKGTDVADASGVAMELRACGVPAAVPDDIGAALWGKAVVNACFNPLTGLLRLPSGALAESEALAECCGLVVEEAVAVARVCGVELVRSEILRRVREVAVATARNRSSMLQDLERGRRTEIDAINGAIARMGEAEGHPCPVNRALTLLVRAAEEAGTAGGRGGPAAAEA